MRLDKFSIPREVFMIINRVTCHEEQYDLVRAVYRYIYEEDEYPATCLRYAGAISAFQEIKAIIDKSLARARKAKERRDDRKAHPEKYPPRRKQPVHKAGAIELPSGHVLESAAQNRAYFDYYCIKDNKVMYFKVIATGELNGNNASYRPLYSPVSIVESLLATRGPAYMSFSKAMRSPCLYRMVPHLSKPSLWSR